VASSLSHGGAQRSAAALTFVFEKLGYEVCVATVLKGVSYSFTGRLFEIHAVKSKFHPLFTRLKKLLVFRRFLEHEKFDLIIDNRARVSIFREIIVTKCLYPKSAIYLIRNYNFKNVFTSSKRVNRWLYQDRRLVAVSKKAADKANFELGITSVVAIPNPLPETSAPSFSSDLFSDLPKKFILFCGRLEDKSKNIRLLLEAYQKSDLASQQMPLVLLGSGPDEQDLKAFAKALGIANNILWIPFVDYPFYVIKKAKFICLTSRYEGFPRALIEALSLGTPVVSVDCESGPSEIVQHEQNGLLIRNYDPHAFAEAMNRLIFDQDLYDFCQANAKSSVDHLSVAGIARQWQDYLNLPS